MLCSEFASAELDDSYFCKCVCLCKENAVTEEWQAKTTQTKKIRFLNLMQWLVIDPLHNPFSPCPYSSVVCLSSKLSTLSIKTTTVYQINWFCLFVCFTFRFKSPLLQGPSYFLPFFIPFIFEFYSSSDFCFYILLAFYLLCFLIFLIDSFFSSPFSFCEMSFFPMPLLFLCLSVLPPSHVTHTHSFCCVIQCCLIPHPCN